MADLDTYGNLGPTQQVPLHTEIWLRRGLLSAVRETESDAALYMTYRNLGPTQTKGEGMRNMPRFKVIVENLTPVTGTNYFALTDHVTCVGCQGEEREPGSYYCKECEKELWAAKCGRKYSRGRGKSKGRRAGPLRKHKGSYR